MMSHHHHRRWRDEDEDRIASLEDQVVRIRTNMNALATDNPYDKIAQLEDQVDRLKKVVHALASALEEHLAVYETQLPAVESRIEDISRIQASQARALRRQDEKLKKGLSIVSDALSTLIPTELPHN